jgi:hypothetical protein
MNGRNRKECFIALLQLGFFGRRSADRGCRRTREVLVMKARAAGIPISGYDEESK